MTTTYSTHQACELAGVSYRQADYAARTGVLVPPMDSPGSGGRSRRYSDADVMALRVIGVLSELGARRPALAAAVTAMAGYPEAGRFLIVTKDAARVTDDVDDELAVSAAGWVLDLDRVLEVCLPAVCVA